MVRRFEIIEDTNNHGDSSSSENESGSEEEEEEEIVAVDGRPQLTPNAKGKKPITISLASANVCHVSPCEISVWEDVWCQRVCRQQALHDAPTVHAWPLMPCTHAAHVVPR